MHRIGIIGCGNISAAYLKLSGLFPAVSVKSVADLSMEAAEARAAEFGATAVAVDALLADAEIEAVVNLTNPAAHFEVSAAILNAGKHLYSEKPLAMSFEDGRRLLDLAEKTGVQIGCAPDTFLGGGGQTARRIVDSGQVGDIIAGSAQILYHGAEHWHPNPGFFYQPGAGPIFDIGPYYLTALVNLIGPIASVAAIASKGFSERLVTAKGPQHNKRILVNTPTTFNVVMEFANGANLWLGASWDVWAHGHSYPIELYGTKGTIQVPDPNFFGGTVRACDSQGDFTDSDGASAPFGAVNWNNRVANYRMVGVAEMLAAVKAGRKARCSGELALHVLEVLEAIHESAERRRFVDIATSVSRPAALDPQDAEGLMAA